MLHRLKEWQGMVVEVSAEDLDGELSGEPVSTAIVEARKPLRIAGDGAASRQTDRDIAGEVPFSLAFNGLAHAVMMVTPTELEDFVYGFALTQEIVERAEEIEAIDIIKLPVGYLAQVTIPKDRFQGVTERRRNLVGQTGCGICGLVELDQAVHALAPIEKAPNISRPAIFKA